MQTYGDIINRIVEIILLSKQRKNEIVTMELNENYNNHFVSKFWYEIAVIYAEEFDELIDAERTFYLLKNAKDFNELNKLNLALKEVCQNHCNEENELTNEFLVLLGILNNSEGKSALELTEYKGYFILKDELSNFITLCRKLKVGPYKSVKDLQKEEIMYFINSEMEQKKDQKHRIDNFLVASFDNSLSNSQEVTKKEENSLFNTIYGNKEKLFERKVTKTYYRELIYLGISGKLSIDMVIELKNIMTTSEFELLLDDLQKWQIFDDKEFLKIKKGAYSSEKTIEDIDQLVGFFVTKENLNIDALNLLIPVIGKENYHYMIDKLFKYGAIDNDAYFNYLEQTIDRGFQKE